MAINTQKFLPLAKSSSAIVKFAGSNISTESSKGGAIIKQKKLDIKKFIPPEKQEEKKEESYGAIIKSLTTIDAFLKSSLLVDRKTTQVEQQDKKEEESKKRENKLEKRDKPKGVSGISGISLPKFDFLESVKRYFLFTFLGWLFTNTQQYLPQLMKIVDIIKPVIRVADFIFKGLLEGFIGFIDLGYKAYDTVRSVVKTLGGEGAQKTFDELSKNLNTLITTTILVAATIASLGDRSKGAPGTQTPKGGAPKPGVPRSLTGRPIPTTSGGRPLGRPDIRNPLRERPRITETGGGRAGSLDIRNPLRQGPKVTTGVGDKLLTGATKNKALLFSVRPFLKRIPVPVVAALIDFGLSVALGENPGRAAFRAIGAGILGAVGAAVGSVVPVAGNIIGGIAGGMLGDAAGGALYDFFFSGKKPQQRKVQKKASGGKVFSRKTTSTQSSPRRTLKVAPKKPTKRPPQKTQPGKDIGGEKKIQQLYAKPEDSVKKFVRPVGGWLSKLGSFIWGGGGGGTTTQSKRVDLSAFELLVENAKVFKEIPVIGEMLSAGIEAGALGQAPSKDLTKNFAKNIGYLVQLQANQQVAQGMTNIRQAIVTLADGGTVPSRTLSISNDNNISDEISKSLEVILNQKIQIAIKNVSDSVQEIYGKKEEEPTTPGGPDGSGGPDGEGGGGGEFTGKAADIPPEGKALLDAIAGAEARGYNIVVGGSTFSSYADHPRQFNRAAGSDAAGRYQFLSTTWDKYKPGKAFTPENQDIAAWRLAIAVYGYGESGLVRDLKKDPMKVAAKLRGTWPSLPGGSQENVHTKGFLNRYNESVRRYQTGGNVGAGSSKSILEAAKTLKGMSTASGPGGGNVSCVWAVNKVFARAGVKTPWGSALSTDKVIHGLDRNGWRRVSARDAKPGDVWVYDANDGRRGHVGIMMDNGRVLSNSSSRASFAWEATPEQLLQSYPTAGMTPAGGAFYRAPDVPTKKDKPEPKPIQPVVSQQQLQNVQLALNKKGNIPITVGGQKYFFRANADGTYRAFKPKNILGYQEEIDITGDKNKAIQDAIRTKISTMYAVPSAQSSEQLPQQSNARIAEGGNMQGGGLIGPSRPNIPNVNRSAYYEEQGSTIVFVPIEKQIMVPVPIGSSSRGPVMFPSSNLNKDTYSIHSLSR